MKIKLYPKYGWFIKCVEYSDTELPPFDIHSFNYDDIQSDSEHWYYSTNTTSVQDILAQNKLIPEQARIGNVNLKWVSESDWIYAARLVTDRQIDNVYAELVLQGIDTFADIYLNGQLVGSHNNMYLRKKIDVSEQIHTENELVIYFHSPFKVLQQLEKTMPEEWNGVIDSRRLIRKATSDFGTFLGNRQPCTCMGLYDEVWIELFEEKARISNLEVSYVLSQDNGTVHIVADALIYVDIKKHLSVWFRVIDPNGRCILERECMPEGNNVILDVSIEHPSLWWPLNYGEQQLYTVRVSIESDGREWVSEDKRIGFRRISYSGNFCFNINGKKIRIWGSNIVNIDGISHWCDRQRVSKLMDYASEGNINTLRVWGEGPLLPDLFYDLADEKGILVWQDFGLGFGLWPNNEQYRAMFSSEVEQLVSRLKHHASLLLWCGSNETYMVGVSEYTQGHQNGFEMIFEDAAGICAQLDPNRPYIPSSPMGGAYPQDATSGDIHGYWGNDFEPGLLYPVLFSESCHATTYCRHSMLQFMSKEEIWPKYYHDTHVYQMKFDEVARKGNDKTLCFSNYWRQISVPDTWKNHLSEFATSELWNIEQYFDANDVDSMLYKYSICGADFYKNEIERIRRGHPCRDSFSKRICNGYLTWKFNDAWPHINFTLIDYYLEATAQYYAVKRAYAPLLAGVAAEQDHLYLWGVNDTANDWNGTITLRVFSRVRNQVEQHISFPVVLRADESKVVDCLDLLGTLHREYVLHTQLSDNLGTIISTNVTYLDMERNLSFPDPTLSLSWDDGYLIVKTDWYARYIELTGLDGNDAFGWKFDDNYFDMLPFETKRIRVSGSHLSGTITAKSNYSSTKATILYQKETVG
ncbi:MAG: beta-mannosidase [Ruminiclostridium sp.]